MPTCQNPRSTTFFLTLMLIGFLEVMADRANAQSACAPAARPAPVDGNTVTLEQLQAALAKVQEFISLSSAYQSCLTEEMEATDLNAPGKANTAKTVDAKIAASQKAKEEVAKSVNAALATYKQLHPN